MLNPGFSRVKRYFSKNTIDNKKKCAIMVHIFENNGKI